MREQSKAVVVAMRWRRWLVPARAVHARSYGVEVVSDAADFVVPAQPAGQLFVPFKQAPAAAKAAFDAWCSSSWLSPRGLWETEGQRSRAQRVLLPFWAFDAAAEVRFRGVVAFKGGRQLAVTQWGAARHTISRGETCAQTYASFELRRDHVAAAARGAHAAVAAPLFASPDAQCPAFQMSRGLAWTLTRRHLEAELRRRASAALCAAACADEVASLELEVTFSRAHATPLRLPVYVLQYEHGTVMSDDQSGAIHPERFTALVGGVSGTVGAQRLLSPRRAQAFAASPAALAALAAQLLSAPASLTAELAFFGALAAILAGVAARRLPYQRHAVEEAACLKAADAAVEEARVAAADAGGWVDERLQRVLDDAEWRRWEETGLWRWEGRRRAEWAATLLRAHAERARQRRVWRAARAEEAAGAAEADRRAAAKAARWGEDWSRGSAGPAASAPRDPLGYYALLGLADRAGVASEGEIKAAFRKKALLLHPDQQEAEAKEAAHAQFRQLSTAYTVLRDPRQRELYGVGG